MSDVSCLKSLPCICVSYRKKYKHLHMGFKNFAYWFQPGFSSHILASFSAQTSYSSNPNILSFHKIAMFCLCISVSPANPLIWRTLPKTAQNTAGTDDHLFSHPVKLFIHAFIHCLTDLYTSLKAQVKFCHSYKALSDSLSWVQSHFLSAFTVLHI